MPANKPTDPNIHHFETEEAFAQWLTTHHDTATEIWIKVHKKHSGLPSIKINEALDVALCWGWIDAVRKSFDEHSYLQRYCPRQKRSIWSRINTEHIARLTKAGRMQPSGLLQVAMAKADGRWDAAYSGSRDMKIPDDLVAALQNNAAAKAMYGTLTSQNRYALAFRLGHIKTAETRAKKVALYVEMLERGETIHPNGAGAGKRTDASGASVKAVGVKRAVAKTVSAKKADAKKATVKRAAAVRNGVRKKSP